MSLKDHMKLEDEEFNFQLKMNFQGLCCIFLATWRC